MHANERKFGLVLGAVAIVAGCLPLWRGHPVRLPVVAIGCAAILIALVRPSLLGPVRRGIGWIQRVVTMTLLFGLVFTPAALVLRALGKTPLRLRRSPTTYWLPASTAVDMTRPF